MVRPLELLAPAANADTAIEAILHGADAVYIGPPGHGARKAASNSIEDIRKVADFAHIFRARVYATVNTIIYEHELRDVEKMIWQLWQAGVDAIIVQDMGILRMNIPPIALHASTQCDIRTPEKARFLQEAGFSQIVLARELGKEEIKRICKSVTIPVECFVHGALCVSYSGMCHASQSVRGRSANRGECAQICRLPYDLVDSGGRKLQIGRHLLSLKDFNQLVNLEELVNAGVTSFKIEGRLKDISYVKNVTAAYSARLDKIVAASNGLMRRSSYGKSEIGFHPDVTKSFNRGFTHYFFDQRSPTGIWEPRTPKSLGEKINNISCLNTGDGISWFDPQNKLVGMNVNKLTPRSAEGRGGQKVPEGTVIYRTFDRVFNQQLSKPTATRKIDMEIRVDDHMAEAHDARGIHVAVDMPASKGEAQKPMDIRGIFSKTGNTPYKVTRVDNNLSPQSFIPASQLTSVRRLLTDALDSANLATYPLDTRRIGNHSYPYPCERLDYKANVSNSLARGFYAAHGVKEIEDAMEVTPRQKKDERQVMTTRHCILREIKMCKKQGGKPNEPLYLRNNNVCFRLGFDCVNCEMGLFETVPQLGKAPQNSE